MKKLVFISGLHRSGTSILHSVISSSDDVSGFSNTGVPKDEGQHLQTIYKPANQFGGPGKFAFDENAKLDENSILISANNREKLLNEWKKYWDTEKSVWIEKSPPNIIRMRFLQELFPDSFFITIIRHPIVVSLATLKLSKTSINELIRHWIVAHKIYQNDKTKIKNEIYFSYEYMIQFPQNVIIELENFLGINIDYKENFLNMNEQYFNMWKEAKPWQILKKMRKSKYIEKYEDSVNQFGYSLINLEEFPKLYTRMDNR